MSFRIVYLKGVVYRSAGGFTSGGPAVQVDALSTVRFGGDQRWLRVAIFADQRESAKRSQRRSAV